MATLIADNLTYSYSKKSKPALNKVSVQIKPGTCLLYTSDAADE